MLVAVDKRGSISLPASIRKNLGLVPGTYLELTMEPGGAITLFPVEIYRTVKLNDSGLQKLHEARESESATLPEWFSEELQNARINCE